MALLSRAGTGVLLRIGAAAQSSLAADRVTWVPRGGDPAPVGSPRPWRPSCPCVRGLTGPCCVQDRTLRLWEYRSGRELHCCPLTSLREPAEPWGDKVTSRFGLGVIAAYGAPLQSLGSWEQAHVCVGDVSLLSTQTPSSLGEIVDFRF